MPLEDRTKEKKRKIYKGFVAQKVGIVAHKTGTTAQKVCTNAQKN